MSAPMLSYSFSRRAMVSPSPTRAVPAPPRTRPTPAHRLGLISSLERLPPCSARMRRWPSESIPENADCALAMVASSRCLIRSSAAAQASSLVSRGITCRRTPKRTLRPAASARLRTSANFFSTSAGGSPQVRYSSICSAAMSCAALLEPPKYSGGCGRCTGGYNSFALLTWRCLPWWVTSSPAIRRVQMSKNSRACS